MCAHGLYVENILCAVCKYLNNCEINEFNMNKMYKINRTFTDN